MRRIEWKKKNELGSDINCWTGGQASEEAMDVC